MFISPRETLILRNQNFTYCCLKAVNQSLTVRNGSLQLVNDWIQLDNASQLIEAADRGQFPCGAIYNGDPQGAPVVGVEYDWFVAECPGWSRSSQSNLNTWLQPLSGFLLPAVIFCLSVPRRRKIHVYPRASSVPTSMGTVACSRLFLEPSALWSW